MQVNKYRYFYLDLFRAIAITLMFITHTFRVQISNPEINTQIGNYIQDFFLFFMSIEPFTSALFLFMVGYSLKINNNSLNYKKNYNKGLKLIGISLLLHIPYHGLNFVELLLSSGVLMVIGLSLIFLNKINNERKIFIFLLMGLVISLIFEISQLGLTGINGGSGALFPLILYSLVGYLSYNITLKIKEIAAILFFLIVMIIFVNDGFRYYVETTRVYLDYEYLQILTKQYKIWNHSFFGFLYNSAILVIISQLFRIKNKIKITFIEEFSKNALSMYILHILFLSIFYITQIGIPNPIFTFIFLMILIMICNRLSKLFKIIKTKYLDSNV